MIDIQRYSDERRGEWDDFVAGAANATFLHMRGYMDYHAHRFADCSLMAFNEKGRPVALLPATLSADGRELSSHAGLTYGGWLTDRRHMDTSLFMEVWDAAIAYMRTLGVERFVYKPVPWVFSGYPSENDLYALWRTGAVKTACQISSAIPLDRPVLYGKTVRYMVGKALRAGVTVERSDDLGAFWGMLEECLDERHDARPVHSLDEMRLLASRFPENIALYMASGPDGVPMAGTVIYKAGAAAHTQYIASTAAGRACGAVNALLCQVIERECAEARYFDFGTSCEDGGRLINHGLLDFKYSLGGRPVCFDTYVITLR